MIDINLRKFNQAIDNSEPIKMDGKVTQVIGLVIESKGPNVSLGELCYIKSRMPDVEPIPAEVVGFREGHVLLMPIGEMTGIGPGCEVVSAQKTLQVKVGPQLLGRVLDGLGNPMDGKGPILSKVEFLLFCWGYGMLASKHSLTVFFRKRQVYQAIRSIRYATYSRKEALSAR